MENATLSKIAATRAYGAEVILHGQIWDEANEKMKQLAAEHGYTVIHPFDDLQLITGQGTLGLEVYDDFPQADVVIVPIGGGGLISGVSTALKARNPNIRIIGVESSDGPAMKRSIEAGCVITLGEDSLHHRRPARQTGSANTTSGSSVITWIRSSRLPDTEIFEAMLWIMSRAKLVVEWSGGRTGRGIARRIDRRASPARKWCVF